MHILIVCDGRSLAVYFHMCNSAAHIANWVENIEQLPIGVRYPVTVFAAIIVGEVEKLLGVCEQVVGISGVDIL